MGKSKTKSDIDYIDVHGFLENILDNDIHAKRIESLANATLGVMSSASFAIRLIGHGLAEQRDLDPKHCVKQVDRLLSNPGIDLEKLFCIWVPYVLRAHHKDVKVILDWTDFSKDNQMTLMLSMATSSGRSTPLMWHTVSKNMLNGKQKQIEQDMLVGLKSVLPEGYEVTVLADRGFSDNNLYELLSDLGFKFCIRFKSNTYVTTKDGERIQVKDIISKGGRAKTFREAKLSLQEFPVETLVVTWEKGMKEPWCLVSNDPHIKPRDLINFYGKRWSTEALFRDKKDIRYGFGMSSIRVKDSKRRDRLFMLGAFAMLLLTMLGAAGEAAGLDRHLKVNTVKTRTISLIRQGVMWYRLIPNMKDERLKLLMKEFKKLLSKSNFFKDIISYI